MSESATAKWLYNDVEIDMEKGYEVHLWTVRWQITTEQLLTACLQANSKCVHHIHDAAVEMGFVKYSNKGQE